MGGRGGLRFGLRASARDYVFVVSVVIERG